ALIAILIVDGLHYFQFTAAKFNHDVIQLPLWALAGYALHAGLRHGRLWHWVLLGLAVGLALWAKYFVAMLAVPFALFMLFDPDARKALARTGPWIAATIALIVMAPHLVWLVKNDFLPCAYADMRAAPARGLTDHVLRPLVFAGGQLFFLLPALLIAAPLLWPRPQAAASAASAEGFDRRVVSLLAFGPAVSVMVLAALSGRGTVAMWGYPLWLFLGLWIVLFAWTAIDQTRMSRTSRSRGRWWSGPRVIRKPCRRPSHRLRRAQSSASRLICRSTAAAMCCMSAGPSCGPNRDASSESE